MKDKEKLLDIISNSENILLISHESPDRDAVGSLVSMYQILQKLGKKDVKMLLETKSSVKEGFLKDMDQIIYEPLKNHIEGIDLVIILDTNSWKRVSKTAEFPEDKPVIIIDHHESKTDIDNDLYVRFDTGSNCEGIYYLFKDEVNIDLDIAKALLMGIYDDTGGFKYRSVDDKTLMAVIDLINIGVDLSEIANESSSLSANMLRAGSSILSNTTIDDEKKIFYGFLSRDISDRYDLDYEDIDMVKDIIIGMLLDVEEIEWGFLVKPKPKGNCTISIRSKATSSIKAKDIAVKFNGGGHDSAAGAPVDIADPKEAMEYVLANIA